MFRLTRDEKVRKQPLIAASFIHMIIIIIHDLRSRYDGVI